MSAPLRLYLFSQNADSKTNTQSGGLNTLSNTISRSGTSKFGASLFVQPLPEVVIEPLEGVSNEWQAHLWALLHPAHLLGSGLDLLGLEQRGVVGLVDLVGGEVGSVDVTGQPGLEWSSDSPQLFKLDTAEEGVALDLMGTTTAQTVLSVAYEAVERLVLLLIFDGTLG